jgi:hypothetical protein
MKRRSIALSILRRVSDFSLKLLKCFTNLPQDQSSKEREESTEIKGLEAPAWPLEDSDGTTRGSVGTWTPLSRWEAQLRPQDEGGSAAGAAAVAVDVESR